MQGAEHFILMEKMDDPGLDPLKQLLIEQTEGWVDGVYVITEGELEEAL